MPEPSLSSSKEYKRALSLAFYILGDDDLAQQVASRVAATHSKELKKQVKNRKTKKHPKWTRVLPNSEFNVDVLTYIKSIDYEQMQERAHWQSARTLDDERMTIRFIKHIIMEGLKRNSSFLNVGLGRLVYYYSYENIVDIQQLLAQSADNFPEAVRFRKHRQVLFKSLIERFNDEQRVGGRFLGVKPFSQHAEAIIITSGNSADYYPLVIKSLAAFTPPSPACPESLQAPDPRTTLLEPFHFDPRTTDRSKEHAIERNRMHAVICPDCFHHVLSAVSAEDPESNLRLPLFSLNGGGNNDAPTGSENDHPRQTAGRSPKKGSQAEETVRRSNNLMLDQIVITVDDKPRKRIDINASQPVRLDLEPGATIIEALAEVDQGTVPLGLIYLDWDPLCDEKTPAQYDLEIEGHCTLVFSISYEMDEDGDEKDAKVMISCAAATKPPKTRKATA